MWPPGVSWYSRRQLPADDLGQPARHREGDRAPGSQHPDQLLDRLDVGRHVLEDLRRDHPVELAVPEGQRQRVALLDVGLRTVGHLAGPAHGREHVAHLGQLVGVLVEGDHVGAAAVHLEGVPAAAAPHVEDAVARPEPEPVEVNGEHVPMASSYAVAVAAATARQLNSSSTRARPAAPYRSRRSGSSSSPAECAGQRLDVARRHEVGAEAVGTDHLGDGTGVGDDQGRRAGHQLGGRQREALVERRHARRPRPSPSPRPARRR